MGKVVNLCWQAHTQDLATGIWQLLQEKYKTDFEVSINGSYISAHQLILAVFCPSIKNSENSAFILGENSNVMKEDLSIIIEFMYLGKVDVCEERLSSIKQLADQLGFSVLSNVISDFLNSKIKPEPRKEKMKRRSTTKAIKKPTIGRKKRTKGRAKAKEFIKLPAETMASLKLQAATLPQKDADTNDNKVEPTNSVNDDSPMIEEETESVGEVPNKVAPPPAKKIPSRRGELCMEYFDPKTFQFYCKQCDKAFVKANELYNHLRVHEEATIKYECQHCDYKSNKRSCFSGHMINIHQMDIQGNLKPKNLQCPHCPHMCSVNFQLKNHIYTVHTAKKQICESCGYQCQSKAGLEKHKKLVHSNVKPHMCETCGFRAKIFSELRHHMRVHFSSKVTCEICGAVVNSTNINAHRKTHSTDPKPHACHLCKFSSWKSWNLKVHLKNMHYDKDEMDDMIRRQLISLTSG